MKVDSKQLKEFLIDAEMVSEKTINDALIKEKETGRPLSDILLEEEAITEENLRKMYAYILGIPFVDLEKETIPKEVLQLVPEPIARKNNIVAFQKYGQELRVAMLNPDDIQTIDFLRKKTGFKIAPCFTSQAGISAALKQYERSLKAEFGDIISDDNKEEESTVDEESLEKIAQDLPIIKIVDTLLKHAILQTASDIHIEPDEKEVHIRYRIDGVLQETMTLPQQVLSGIIARIKVLANLKLDEHRIPQDGRFKIEEDGRKTSFRVSILPVFDGEKVVMRVLNESVKGLTLEDMGFWGLSLERIHAAIKRPNGMVLVTGPTGSGKTTTLYTVMDILNTPEVNVSTIEDPIEYRMPRINQTQVQAKVGMTFASGLRALLRQDPDIIMVGEIRDSETMQIAMNAAMTGHLVLSTLHTNSAAAAISRMADMKAEPFLIASTVNVILAQRLVRKICQHCKKEIKINPKKLNKVGESFDFGVIVEAVKKGDSAEIKALAGVKNLEEATFYKGEGCDKCGGEGYKGRVGVYEVLQVSESIQKLIGSNATADDIDKVARKEGMFSMFEDGLIKAMTGVTTLEEILRATEE
jgi:type IV pilus assembly protein PilB